MYEELKRLVIALGDFIHTAKNDLARDGADNLRWKNELKERCLRGIRSGLESELEADVSICLVETPYNTKVPGRGRGRNEMSCRIWERGRATRTITVLADVVDGSWNAACGLPWSASTMVALTGIAERHPQPDDLVLSDFRCGLVVPLVGDLASPREPAGFYYGLRGEGPRYRLAGSATEYPLRPTDIENVQHTRFFLDLFTAETFETLAVSIDAVKPLMHDWGDIGRFYGAGIELMSLLGRPGMTPGFGGYVAANQKADNLIPTKMLLEGAGVIVTNWWGEPIDRMKIMDRMYVAIAANKPLHEHLVRHLSRTARLP
jgi:fructose-1,6-bisphosphatase/inositol monophosphatase family enzyme